MVAGSSSDPKQGSLSFFKIVRYPSAPHLSLPTAFVRRYLERIPKNPTLKTATGEHSWRLKIEKIGGDYCFGHGWEKLVKDTQLRIKDVLVFCLIDPFTFQVSFFDADGCEKDLPLINTSDGDENLGFQRVISEKTNKYTMTLPKKFVEAAGLENKTGIKMKDHEGKEWMMGLLAERYERTKYSLSSGWCIFRQYHKLADGDICTFKFSKKEGVLILAQMLKNKRAMKQERNVDDGVKRKRPGRPPIEKHGGGGGVDVKIEDEEAEVVKKKRPLHVKPGGSVNVKLEDESGLEAAERGRPPLGGGVNVKLEDESGPEEAERGRPPLGGGVNVKIEDEPVVIVKRKRGRPPLKKPGGGGSGGVNIKFEAEVVMRPPVEKSGGGVEVKRKRGRPRLDDLVRREAGVIYF